MAKEKFNDGNVWQKRYTISAYSGGVLVRTWPHARELYGGKDLLSFLNEEGKKVKVCSDCVICEEE